MAINKKIETKPKPPKSVEKSRCSKKSYMIFHKKEGESMSKYAQEETNSEKNFRPIGLCNKIAQNGEKKRVRQEMIEITVGKETKGESPKLIVFKNEFSSYFELS